MVKTLLILFELSRTVSEVIVIKSHVKKKRLPLRRNYSIFIKSQVKKRSAVCFLSQKISKNFTRMRHLKTSNKKFPYPNKNKLRLNKQKILKASRRYLIRIVHRIASYLKKKRAL